MTTKKQISEVSENPVNRGRHGHQCRICSHPKRDEIEQAFIGWVGPVQIAKKYSVSRDGIYRHAHAFGLMDKRRRNVRAALERIIEKASDVSVGASCGRFSRSLRKQPNVRTTTSSDSSWQMDTEPGTTDRRGGAHHAG